MSPCDDVDLESVYAQFCASEENGSTVILQNTQRLSATDNLFYTDVLVQDAVVLNAMLDSGSMACSLSSSKLPLLEKANVVSADSISPTSVTLIGCGGLKTSPIGVCEIQMKVLGCHISVPTLIVDGQSDDLILGSNVIKHLVRVMKTSGKASMINQSSGEEHALLQLLDGVEKWRGSEIPDKVGTVKLKHAVTLEPMREHLVWGRLPNHKYLSAGSTVVVEPSESRTVPRTVIVGRTVTPLWGDGWVPVRVINPSHKHVTLRRNCKIADVSPCVALEDFDIDYLYEKDETNDVKCNVAKTVDQADTGSEKSLTVDSEHLLRRPTSSALRDLGLQDIDVDSSELSPFWRSKLVDLLARYESVFSRNSLDCGKAKDFVHRIRLSDSRPFRLPYRRLSPSHYEKLRLALNEMEERDIIRKSSSEYASPLVLVWKKNGDLRLCTDFRWLNARTIKDAHPLPHQADALAALGGNAFFSTMDLTSGYYNVEVHEEDKKFTAFTSPFGLYEYNRLPQGLCNSPATFMRMMMSIFGDQNFLSLLCYLDDILVFAPNEQVALQRLEMVFERLKAHNLRLAPKKCHFMRSSVKFLGHIVTKEGISTDPEKVRAIMDLSENDLMVENTSVPSPSKIRSFLGMVGFYQQFFEGYSQISKPLFALTSGMKRPRHAKGKGCSPVTRKLTSADWTAECSEAFGKLKEALLDNATLAHPDFSRPFLLSVDASSCGLGAVLSQLAEGDEVARPIAFASKSLNYAQSRYPAHRLEFLALKWAVCDKFSHWLRGHSFTVWTDNNPLTYILTKPKLDACEQRWVAKLAPFDFSVKYIPGPKNVVADALSREPFAQPSMLHRLTRVPYGALMEEADAWDSDCVQDAFRQSNDPRAMLQMHHQAAVASNNTWSQTADSCISKQSVSAVLVRSLDQEYLPPQAFLLPQLVQSIQPSELSEVRPLPRDELMAVQRADLCLSRVLQFVERQRRPSRRERAHEPVEALRLLRHWEKLTVRTGVLYRVTKDAVTGRKTYQYVVPCALKEKVLEGVHNEAGHQGQRRTLYLCRQRFYWHGMERDVRDFVRCCRRCVFSKSPEPAARAPLESVTTSRPLELVCIDFWSAEDSSNKSLDVLVVTDHFTKLSQAYLCPNQSAKAVAQQLWNNFFCVYGFPERVHSDQGANFESSLIKEMLLVAGVHKSHTTPYHPMGNGAVERFNRTLGNMIRALPPRAKHRWPQLLRSLTFSYNATVHETTGFAPFQLMFGRTPRLPVDLMFGSVLLDDQMVDYDTYVQCLRRDLAEALRVAQISAVKQQQKQTDLYNRKVKGVHVDVGDRVLLANKGERGKKKLADRWENNLYTVVEKHGNTHTFRIRNCATAQEKVVHRNLILPVNFLPLPTEPEDGGSCVSDLATGASDDSLQSDDVAGSVRLPDCDPEDRTASWISQIPASTGDQLTAPCDVPVADVSKEIADRSDWTVSSDLPAVTVCPADLADTEPVASVTTLGAEPSVVGSVDRSSVGHTLLDSACSDRPPGATRYGRVVRPVVRLIQQMHQKVLAGM